MHREIIYVCVFKNKSTVVLIALKVGDLLSLTVSCFCCYFIFSADVGLLWFMVLGKIKVTEQYGGEFTRYCCVFCKNVFKNGIFN